MNKPSTHSSTPSENYTTTILSDVCLQHSPWLQVTFEPNAVEATSFAESEKILKAILLQATQKKLTQISLTLPIEWKDAERTLTSLGWQKSLVRYVREPKPSGIALQTNIVFTTEKPSVAEIMPLLLEQAAYHGNLYPEYYKNPEQINLDLYTQEVEADLADPKTLTVVGRDPTTNACIAYLQASKTATGFCLYEVIVSQKYRGQLIGSDLLQSFFNLADVASSSTELETWHDQAAQYLYKKFGFVATAEEYYLQMG